MLWVRVGRHVMPHTPPTAPPLRKASSDWLPYPLLKPGLLYGLYLLYFEYLLYLEYFEGDE